MRLCFCLGTLFVGLSVGRITQKQWMNFYEIFGWGVPWPKTIILTLWVIWNCEFSSLYNFEYYQSCLIMRWQHSAVLSSAL